MEPLLKQIKDMADDGFEVALFNNERGDALMVQATLNLENRRVSSCYALPYKQLVRATSPTGLIRSQLAKIHQQISMQAH